MTVKSLLGAFFPLHALGKQVMQATVSLERFDGALVQCLKELSMFGFRGPEWSN